MGERSATLVCDDDELSFTSFAERAGTNLRQALIAAYGPDVGADVTADALAYAWEHWERLRTMQNPTGYLYRVAQSSARRGIFRKPPRYQRPEPPPDPFWIEPGLDEAIASLSRQQRAAVMLVHGYGWTITEVADLWGVTHSTVGRHLERAMTTLRRRLGVEP
jgi:RNA polymerase sigma factor (sigma-70 family)